MGIVKKGRAIARKDEVIELLGVEPHLEINAEDAATVSSAAIDAALHEKFADDGLQGFSSAGAKHAAEGAIAKAKADALDKFMPLSETLKRIADVDGDINWVALAADKNPYPTDEGAGSIEEMRRAFAPTTVCAAMLRLQFKTPGAMLTKFVYIWWSGSAVGAVKRGKLTSLEEKVEDTVRLPCSPHDRSRGSLALTLLRCCLLLWLDLTAARRSVAGEKTLHSSLLYRGDGRR